MSHQTKIKICGMRRAEDISFVNKYQPDYAGFILSQGFKRTVTCEDFYTLREKLSKDIKAVGVFVNEPLENIVETFAGKLDVIQLHGDENEEYIRTLKAQTNCEIWKAVRVQTTKDIEKACTLSADKLLIDSFSKDSYGGTGKRVNLEIIKNAEITKPFFLAGGLNGENVQGAINEVHPYGVDFSSSVETDGFKDEKKICEIVKKIRRKDFITPPNHVNFLAKKLLGKCEISDVSIAYLEKNGGGPTENHTHPHDHFFIVTEGEAKIILGSKEIIVKKDESILVKGEIPHSVWNNISHTTTMIGINVINNK